MNTEQSQNVKKHEYQERYRFWTDKKISQFSFQNNLYLTISLALMGYFWKERGTVYTELIIDSNLAIDRVVVLFLIGLTFLLYSIITGLFLAISRLYDLRLTSNILLTRKRALKKGIIFHNDNSSNNCMCKQLISLLKLFNNYNSYEISDNDINGNKENLQNKFTESRQLSKNIGKTSWILMKNQTISLLISVLIFMLVLIMKSSYIQIFQ